MYDGPHEIRNPRVATPPNLLSLIRVLLLPPTLLALGRQETAGPLPPLVLIACALGTDALDGLLARRRGWVSDTGRGLDPLADKIYLGGIVLYLALARDFPLWLVALIVARDLFLILAGTLLVRRYRVMFAANVWGKVSTALLGTLVMVYILHLEELAPWLIAAVVIALGVSLATYVLNAVRFLREREARLA